MADIQQPDIIGNYLQQYYGAKDRQQQQADAQFQKERQMKQDSQQSQMFDMNMSNAQIERGLKLAQRKYQLLGDVMPGDVQGFEAAKAQYAQEAGVPLSSLSGVTIDQLGQLREQGGQEIAHLNVLAKKSGLATDQAQRGLIGAQTDEARAKAKAMGAQAGGTYGSGSAAPEIAPGVFVPDPYSNIQDPKQRDQFYRQNAKEFDARQKTYNEDRVAANNIINLTKEFTAIGDKVGSGGMTGTGGVSSMWGVSALRRGLDSNWQRLSAIQDRLAPLMRQGMPGAASDRDVAMFRGASVSTDNYGPANKAIAQGLQNAAKNAIDQGLFNEWYFQKFKHLQGSDNAWNQYLQDNPIFDPSSDLADAKLNKNRMTWKQYFSGQRAASAGSAPAPAAAPAPVAPTQQSGAVPPPPPGFVVR